MAMVNASGVVIARIARSLNYGSTMTATNGTAICARGSGWVRQVITVNSQTGMLEHQVFSESGALLGELAYIDEAAIGAVPKFLQAQYNKPSYSGNRPVSLFDDVQFSYTAGDPIADTIGAVQISAGSPTFRFGDASAGGPLSFLWDFGDGATSTERNPEHVYTTPGDYDVTLTVANAAGQATATIYDEVTVLPVYAEFTFPRAPYVVPATIAFADASTYVTTSPATWLWDFGDGAASTEQNPTHTYTVPGHYLVSLTSTTPEGESSAQWVVRVRGLGATVMWGDDYEGIRVPNGTIASDLSMGRCGFALAVLPNGRIGAWGSNSSGQCTPPDINDAVAVFAGGYYGIAIRRDGSLVGWGDVEYGAYAFPDGLKAIDVAAGDYHSLIIEPDLTVRAFGANWSGQCNVPEGLKAIAVAAGEAHSAAIRPDGTVVVWGSTSYSVQVPPVGLQAMTIDAGANRCIAIDRSGDVHVWGRTYDEDAVPANLSATAVHISGGFSMAIRPDNTVAVWGDDYNHPCSYLPNGLVDGSRAVYAIGSDDWSATMALAAIPFMAIFSADVTTGAFPLSVNFTDASPGEPATWLWDFGDGATSTEQNPTHIYESPGSYTVTLTATVTDGGSDTRSTENMIVVKDVAAAMTLSKLVGASPTRIACTDVSTGAPIAWQWDFGDGATSDEQHPEHIYSEPGTYTITLTVSGEVDTSVVTKSVRVLQAGSVIAWGSNDYGLNQSPPGLIATAIDMGSLYAVALTPTGTVVAWGSDSSGKTTVPNGLVATKIVCGASHTLVVTPSGRVVAWGWNSYGQCDVPAGLVAIDIAAGAYHSAALREDGSVVVWGRRADGVTDVPYGLVATQIAACDDCTIALRPDGSIVAWGSDEDGVASGVPTDIKAIKIDAHGGRALAVADDDTIRVWGTLRPGDSSAAGQGRVSTAISCGDHHVVAIRASDDRVIAWGDCDAGQCAAPLPFPAIDVAAGYWNTVAIVGGVKITGVVHNVPGRIIDTPNAPKSRIVVECRGVSSRVSADGSFGFMTRDVPKIGEKVEIRIRCPDRIEVVKWTVYQGDTIDLGTVEMAGVHQYV